MNDIDKFLIISKEIGKDFSLVQGPGGNTSYKVNNKINIKKTGTYLKNSTEHGIFIEENLDELETFYKNRNDNYQLKHLFISFLIIDLFFTTTVFSP